MISDQAPVSPNEVPAHDDHVDAPGADGMSRRTAMKMFSLSALVAMASGCIRKPTRRIVSVHDRPEYQQPGMPLYYASTWTEGAHPYGMLIKQIDGRPIKIEGLEGHPLNPTGTSTSQMQASLFNLYDPARLRSPMLGEAEASWQDADKAVVDALKGARRALVVTRPTLGPSETALLERFLKAVPGARHLTYEPAQDRTRRLTWQKLYGAPGEVITKLENAKVVLSIDADFLGTDGDTLTNARGFATTRVPGTERFSRLYVAEGGMTSTGSSADHRIPLRPSAAAELAAGLVAALGGSSAALNASATKHGWDAKVLKALVSDLDANKGKAAVLAGPHLPPVVHAAVAQLNASLGASGATLGWNATPAAAIADEPAQLRKALGAGPDVAIFLGVNPGHDLPGGGFAEAAKGVKTLVAHGMTRNETLALAGIALPSAHAMESWNDATVTDGVTGIAQPMVAPLFGGRAEADSLLAWTKALSGDASLKDTKDFHGFIKARWGLAQRAWEDALRKGWVGAPKNAALPAPREIGVQPPAAPAEGTVDVVLAVHPNTGDGRYAGNTWLLEAPESCSKVTWDNVAAMAPATARKLGVGEGDWVSIEANGATVKLPALPQPGVQHDTIVTHVGYGRTEGAGHGNGVGVNVAALGTGLVAATVSKAGGENYPLAKTQHIFDQDYSNTGTPMKRHIAIGGTPKEYAAYQANPPAWGDGQKSFPDTHKHKLKLDQIDPPVDYSQGHKWGLAIDLNKCTGCHACLLACQSENNVIVVGKEEVALGRDMSWIRIDRYEAGDEDNPDILLQPMLCQHCDNAPCETVCPVNATAHSPEGLNDQIYNRCVGTRYCANNCPYKVRRFNFFNYVGREMEDPVQELRNNPHVTVRTRGVMEKCTFCVQRINAGKFAAANKHEELEDGAIVTACQQACPSDAIVFGDANVEGGLLDTARKSDLAYHVLEEINTRPNVTYGARIRNAHPDLDGFNPSEKGGH